MQQEDINRKLAPGETPALDVGDFLREASAEMEFSEGRSVHSLHPEAWTAAHFVHRAFQPGPHLFPLEHQRVNECMQKQQGKKFERAMRACKKPYEKLWTAYGSWFQSYFSSMTGESCKEEFNALNDCIGPAADVSDVDKPDVIEKCKGQEQRLMRCRADTMFSDKFKAADQCVGKKTPECELALRAAARSTKLATVYHTAFWSFVTDNAEDFLNTEFKGGLDGDGDDE